MAEVLKVQRWIARETNTTFTGGMIPILKDGQVLCKLANALDHSNAIKKIYEKKKDSHVAKNIQHFLKWSRRAGLRQGDLFSCEALQFAKDPNAVIHTLKILYQRAQAGTLVLANKPQASSGNKLQAFLNEPPNSPKPVASAPAPMSPKVKSKIKSPIVETTTRPRGKSKLEAFLHPQEEDEVAAMHNKAHLTKAKGPSRERRKPKRGAFQSQDQDSLFDSVSSPPSPRASSPPPRTTSGASHGDPRRQMAEIMKANSSKPRNKLNAFLQNGSLPSSDPRSSQGSEEEEEEEELCSEEEQSSSEEDVQPVERKNKLNAFLDQSTATSSRTKKKFGGKSKLTAFLNQESDPSDSEEEDEDEQQLSPPASNAKPKSSGLGRMFGFGSKKYSKATKTSDDNSNDDSGSSDEDTPTPKSKFAMFLNGKGPSPRAKSPKEKKKSLKKGKKKSTGVSKFPFTPRSRPVKSSGRVTLLNRRRRPHRRPMGYFSLEESRSMFLQDQRERRPSNHQSKTTNNNEAGEQPKNAFVQGLRCYIPDEDQVWIPGTVLRYDSRKKIVYLDVNDDVSGEEDLEEVSVDLTDASIIRAIAGPAATSVESLPLASNHAHASGVEDMRKLQHLNEPSILYNLARRFATHHPYTYTNDILIAINPYQWLEPLYGQSQHAQYSSSGKSKDELPPHVYYMSTRAYHDMTSRGTNQSILVSGESGAGKTETTKITMQHLASIARGKGRGKQEEEDTIAKVMDVNPLLESFGNAQTTRNDNSSRFGKFTQMQFDTRGRLVGAECETYLLEKSRVVSMEKGERNYHIFYQILLGSSSRALKALRLSPATCYRYLGDQKAESYASSHEDREDFDTTKSALELIGLKSEGLVHILAGILHLGQLEFEDQGEESSVVTSRDELESIEKLLGLPEDALEHACCNRTVKARSEEYTVTLSREDAMENRDALSKTIYSKLFDWLVRQINEAMSGPTDVIVTQIGVLDIFGFESFKHNGFEQFCINYANEKLQQKFTSDVFKSVQQEYTREGLDWEHIEYSDNQEICTMIEGKLGIIALMNDHLRQPKGTEEALVNKIKRSFAPSRSSPTSAPAKVKIEFLKRHRTKFTIHHYANPVTYEAVGFMEKHKDMLLPDLLELMKSSHTSLIQDLFKDPELAQDVESENDFGTARRNKKSALAQRTLGTQFKNSLSSLLANIDQTTVHYIRCIKPNAEKSSSIFDERLVVEQLRSAGVIEAIRISRAGYPSHLDPADILEKYRPLLPPSMAPSTNTGENMTDKHLRRSVRNFLTALGRTAPAEYQLGKTTVYFKSGIVEELESMKTIFYHQQAKLIQTVGRGYVQSRRYGIQIRAAIVVQSFIRMTQDRLEFALRRQSALMIQKCFRRFVKVSKYASVEEKKLALVACALTTKSHVLEPAGRPLSRQSGTLGSSPHKSSFEQQLTEKSLEQQTLSRKWKDEKSRARKNTREKIARAREAEARSTLQLDAADQHDQSIATVHSENQRLKTEVEILREDLMQLQKDMEFLKQGMLGRRSGSTRKVKRRGNTKQQQQQALSTNVKVAYKDSDTDRSLSYNEYE